MKLFIECRRWFQKSYGNTYHAVKIHTESGHIRSGMQYGYGDQCLQTARKILEKKGIIEKSNEPTWKVFQDNEIKYSITDVSQERDLKEF